jgi:serine/threonine protein kinase
MALKGKLMSDTSIVNEVPVFLDADPFYEMPNKESEVVRLSAPDATSLIGVVIAGRYEIISFLGEGGMSSVFKAKDLVINRIIALKILLAMRSADERSIVRFQKEAMAAGRLNHPNIVQLHDVGTHADGTPYLVMDYVAGDTLAHRLHQTGSLPPVEALKLFIQICDALQHAHLNGVIHRDIKPSNLLITTAPDGSEMIKILDFGIAKIWDETITSQQATRTGEVFGSPLYMSPEQAVGNQIDARSDIYSTGCSLFESLCGVPPHMGESTLHTIMKHQSDKAPSLREASLGGSFPSELETIVAKTLMKDPKDRFQSMSELGEALGNLLRRIEKGEKLDTAYDVTASTSSNSDKLVRSSLRVPITLGALVICILAITVSSVVFSGVGGRPKSPITQTPQSSPAKSEAPIEMVLPPSEHEAENHMEDGELETMTLVPNSKILRSCICIHSRLRM